MTRTTQKLQESAGQTAKRVGMVLLTTVLFAAAFLSTGILAVSPTATASEASAAYGLALYFCLLLGIIYSYGVLKLVTLHNLLEWMLNRPPTSRDDLIEALFDFASWFFLFFGPFFLTWGGSIVLDMLAASAGTPTALMVTNGWTSYNCGVAVSPGPFYWIPVSLFLAFSVAAYVFNTEDLDKLRDDYLARKHGPKR